MAYPSDLELRLIKYEKNYPSLSVAELIIGGFSIDQSELYILTAGINIQDLYNSTFYKPRDKMISSILMIRF